MTAPTVDSWSQAIALIDELIADTAQSKITIAALVSEISLLRRAVADRDGRIADLHARIAATGGVR